MEMKLNLTVAIGSLSGTSVDAELVFDTTDDDDTTDSVETERDRRGSVEIGTTFCSDGGWIVGTGARAI